MGSEHVPYSSGANLHSPGFRRKGSVKCRVRLQKLSRMKRTEEKQTLVFPQRKTPLPQLTPQELKVILSRGAESPQTKVVFQIPLNYDIMCVQGIRDWKSQRDVTIEQDDITTIKSDKLGVPSFKMVIQPVDQFEGLDSKVREIEQCAEMMERDLDDLDIPHPAERPTVEPLFTTTYTRRSVTVQETENLEGTSHSKKDVFTRTAMQQKSSTSTDRAREKVRLAQRTMKGTFGASSSESVDTREGRNKKREHTSGKINWARINELMQQEEF